MDEDAIQAALEAYEAELRGEPDEEVEPIHPADVIADALRAIKLEIPSAEKIDFSPLIKAIAAGRAGSVEIASAVRAIPKAEINVNVDLAPLIDVLRQLTEAQKEVARAILSPRQVVMDKDGEIKGTRVGKLN